ncbi:serine/threonine-protein phosphatase 2A [Vairimorpha necatrix]|uniref:Serine/threonine-protein phosphatase 2A n=1 Tax=Vairimorpha necatrix TaxID=6039 RepID=A0AAX4JEF3_9MICR
MENVDFSNIDFSTFQTPDLLNLQSLIGKELDLTKKLISYLTSNSIISPEILPLCSLLLIENRNSVCSVIHQILLKNPSLTHEYITNLQKSKFFNQRCAVPQIIVNLPGTKNFLKKSFSDPIGLVVKEAVKSINKYDSPVFNDDELLNIANMLNNNQYEYIQCLVPDILIFIKQKNFLITQISLSKSWRKRLSLVKKIGYFSVDDKINLYNILSKDPEECIRLKLVENINDNRRNFEDQESSPLPFEISKKFAQIFINDKSENVRKLAVQKICHLHDDLLDDVVNDESWLVRKELLCIHREDIYEKISLPIIRSLPKNNIWRIKIEILDTILHIVDHNDKLVQRHLQDTLFQYLTDPVYEVRNKAGLVLKELIIKSEWSKELEEKMEDMMNNSYLVRITSSEAYYAFDKKYKTRFIKRLLRDEVINVRSKVMNIIKKEDLDEEMIEIIKGMHCDDTQMRQDVERLLQ